MNLPIASKVIPQVPLSSQMLRILSFRPLLELAVLSLLATILLEQQLFLMQKHLCHQLKLLPSRTYLPRPSCLQQALLQPLNHFQAFFGLTQLLFCDLGHPTCLDMRAVQLPARPTLNT